MCKVLCERVDRLTPIWLLTLVLGIALVILLLIPPFSYSADYYTYIETAKHFSGIPVEKVFEYRIIKPLTGGAILVGSYIAGSYERAFLWIAILGFIFSVPLAYRLGLVVLRDKLSAAMFVMWIMLSYPMLRYGLDIGTDSIAWALYLAAMLGLAWFWFEGRLNALWFALVTILIAFFWKEYSVVNLLALQALVLMKDVGPLLTRAKRLLILDGVFVLPHILWQIFVYQTYQYSYYDWYFKTKPETPQMTAFFLAKSLFALLMVGWIVIPLAVLKWREYATDVRAFLLVSLLSASLAFAWGWSSSRLFFVLAPPLALLALLYLRRAVPRPAYFIALGSLVPLSHLAWYVISV